jgi:hypothetical protein
MRCLLLVLSWVERHEKRSCKDNLVKPKRGEIPKATNFRAKFHKHGILEIINRMSFHFPKLFHRTKPSPEIRPCRFFTPSRLVLYAIW